MKVRFAATALFATLACIAARAQTSPLPSIAAVHQLTRAQADQHLPVAFEATVIYCLGYDHTLYVQDEGQAIVVKTVQPAGSEVGDRILVRGITQSSFRTVIHNGEITLLHHGQPPSPIPSTFEQMVRGERDALFVSVRATVRSASLVRRPAQAPVQLLYLEMVTAGGPFDAIVNSDDAAATRGLVDAQVEITGAEGGKFDDKMEQTGVLLHVWSLNGVRVLAHSSISPWDLPETPMDRILTWYSVADRTQRVRVRGTITYYQPGAVAILQSGRQSLWVPTRSSPPLRVGDVVDATGFPGTLNGFLSMSHGELQGTGSRAPVEPRPVTWHELAESNDRANGHHYDLVSLEGEVVAQVRAAAQDEYVIATDGRLFSALYRHPLAAQGQPAPPMKHIPIGSRVRVTGICLPDSADPLSGPVAFNLLLRSFDDIAVLSGPPFLNLRHMMMIAGVLFLALLGIGVRAWMLERRFRHRNALMAYQEKRRAGILVDINNGRPLAEILERVTELVSARLGGAACWMQVIDGARLGNPPVRGTSGLRVIEQPISSRTDAVLGTLSAALPAGTDPSPDETQALVVAAGLATLAIESSRLYSDLVRRSEFDLLTDVQNRFSLEKVLDAQIEAARQTAGIFGLLFIDLDRFKQVNDEFGHHVGDLYLQEAAMRMKRQLRPDDVLARVGGDEFAVIVPTPRSRGAVEEIATRLERCFEEPFHCDGNTLEGRASVGIALYPEDGTRRDSLMKAADAAMYVNKSQKQETFAPSVPLRSPRDLSR